MDADYSLAVVFAALVWGGPLRILTAEMEPGRWVACVSQWIPLKEWAGTEEEAIAAVRAKLAPAFADWPELEAQFEMPWEYEAALSAIERDGKEGK